MGLATHPTSASYSLVKGAEQICHAKRAVHANPAGLGVLVGDDCRHSKQSIHVAAERKAAGSMQGTESTAAAVPQLLVVTASNCSAVPGKEVTACTSSFQMGSQTMKMINISNR